MKASERIEKETNLYVKAGLRWTMIAATTIVRPGESDFEIDDEIYAGIQHDAADAVSKGVSLEQYEADVKELILGAARESVQVTYVTDWLPDADSHMRAALEAVVSAVGDVRMKRGDYENMRMLITLYKLSGNSPSELVETLGRNGFEELRTLPLRPGTAAPAARAASAVAYPQDDDPITNRDYTLLLLGAQAVLSGVHDALKAGRTLTPELINDIGTALCTSIQIIRAGAPAGEQTKGNLLTAINRLADTFEQPWAKDSAA